MSGPTLQFCEEADVDRPVLIGIVRDAFWNLYQPGCDEHVVLQKLWDSDDYLRDLSLVAKANDGKIAGYIAYSKSRIVDSAGSVTEAITFGPVAVSPGFQGKGIGKKLIKKSIQNCREKGHKVIVILGYPTLYSQFGFRNGQAFGVTTETGETAKGLQVLELEEGFLDNVSGRYFASKAFEASAEEVEEAEKGLPTKEKFETRSQQMFGIVVGMKAEDEYPPEFDAKLCNDRRRL